MPICSPYAQTIGQDRLPWWGQSKALGELPAQLIAELPNIQVFGAVGDKNFTRMGDVTGSGVVSSMVHNVTVGKTDLSSTLQESQKKLDDLIKPR